jgi:oligopeptide transport system substrate-binding protein
MKHVLFCLLSLCLGAGCSNRSSSPCTEARLYLQEDPLSLDPRIGYDRGTQQVLREVYEGLTRIGPDGQPHLALAKAVETSEDGLVYTFTLQPSLWSNGLEVTADDFVFAWKSSLDPNDSNVRSDSLFIISNAKRARSGECSLDKVGVRALNRHKLEVTLEHPAPYFLELLANPVFSPLCRSVVEKDPRFASGERYVSNGPFFLKERKLQSHIVLEKNPRYWNPDQPRLDRITFSIIDDPQTAYNMFLANVVDWYGEPCGTICPKRASDLYKKGLLTCHDAGASYQLLVQTRAPHLRSAPLRRALAHAINRKSICESVLQGGERPAFSLSPQPLSFLQRPFFEDNQPQTAQKLFSEGLEELGFTEETYPPLVLSFWAEPAIKSMMEAIQAQLTETLRIKVVLEPLDRGSYLKKVYAGEYQIMNLALNARTHDPSSNLDIFKFKKTPLNGTGWSDPEYTRMLDLAAESQDPKERNEYFRRAEECIMRQLPVIPLCYQTLKYMKSSRLSGEVVSPVGIVELKWIKQS